MSSKKAPPVKPVKRHAPASAPSPAEIRTETAVETAVVVAEPVSQPLQADRKAAVAKLVELKQADQRDDAAIYAQKVVVQGIDAAIAAHDAPVE